MKNIFSSKRKITFTSCNMWKSCSLNLVLKKIIQTRFFQTVSYSKKVGKLSIYEVNQMLTANECAKEFNKGPVKSLDSNSLGSNIPIEDSRSAIISNFDSSLLVGVFDGHGGPACSQVVSKRIMRMIATSLMPKNLLKTYDQSQNNIFASCLNDSFEFVDELKHIYEESFAKYVADLINDSLYDTHDITEKIKNAFFQLDKALSDEALNYNCKRTMAVALSGTCALLAHVSKNNLTVANLGDCVAVVGSYSENGEWIAKKITNEHNADNLNEIRRIISEHPNNEKDSVIRSERLLGQLAPLRALGDFRFKWSKKILEELVVPIYGLQSIPVHYNTPPYLSPCPEIFQYNINTTDKFLVLATDGLWEIMTPMQAIRLIGEHMVGKAFLQPLRLPKRKLSIGDINIILDQRAKGLLMQPHDRNAATHLIRNALGGTEYGISEDKLSHMLSLPQEIVRLFRDDITIMIVYFDSNFIRTCPTVKSN
ncbi:pyruvate dehydrogenase [acetyl-transferring]-phosphatase 1, mitochondrial isoform X2 [Culicoides brevitarsis]|uniref:pyruvate dehydrogenase [acetyl-transferring]-phosphatase 1, mitochondrial isoform X2 n=1 Tax=Culicoides brevitarsis TaxID=469753 RepID=UPI00307B122C